MSHSTYILAAFIGLVGCTGPTINSPEFASGKTGKPFQYQITTKGHASHFAASVPPPQGLTADPNTGLISGTPLEAGTFKINLLAANRYGEDNKTLHLTVCGSPSSEHPVVNEKELFITHPEVLNAPDAKRGGAWHIRTALQKIAGNNVDVDDFATAWFNTWTDNTSLPEVDQPFAARSWVTKALQSAWNEDRIKLIGIVNRIDLARFMNNDRSLPPVSLGEGRFVYEVVSDQNEREFLTIIFEYQLPIDGTPAEALKEWAKKWHDLGRPELGKPDAFPIVYLNALREVTNAFSSHGNLNQIRTNEFLPPTPQAGNAAPPRIWELREFGLNSSVLHSPGLRLVQRPVKHTPDTDKSNTSALEGFIQSNETKFLSGLPVEYPRNLGAAVSHVPSPRFSFHDPLNPDRATFIASFNACAGCHANDTGTTFQHIGVLAPNKSPFLNGQITLPHALPPLNNDQAQHDEMAQRALLLKDFFTDAPQQELEAFSKQGITQLIKERSARTH